MYAQRDLEKAAYKYCRLKLDVCEVSTYHCSITVRTTYTPGRPGNETKSFFFSVKARYWLKAHKPELTEGKCIRKNTINHFGTTRRWAVRGRRGNGETASCNQ